MYANPETIHPIAGYENEIYVKPTIQNPQIIVGDFTYIADSDFESHVSHLYEWNGDRLVIGKFCQIASGTKFIMGPANHRLCSVTTYPFNVFGGAFTENTPDHVSQLPHKGDTVVGNDVWFGRESVIMPGVKIGDGAIIAAYSVVAKDVEPYTLVGGNPAHFIKKRFNDELTELLLKLKWWDFQGKKLAEILPLLCDPDLQKVANEIKRILDGQQN